MNTVEHRDKEHFQIDEQDVLMRIRKVWYPWLGEADQRNILFARHTLIRFPCVTLFLVSKAMDSKSLATQKRGFIQDLVDPETMPLRQAMHSLETVAALRCNQRLTLMKGRCFHGSSMWELVVLEMRQGTGNGAGERKYVLYRNERCILFFADSSSCCQLLPGCDSPLCWI